MEFNQYFEVDLNFISSSEYRSQPEDVYRMEYEPLVVHMLGNEGIFLFGEDLLNKFNNKLLSEILEENMNYVPGINQPNPGKQGKFCHVYLDTWMPLSMEPRHKLYDPFFAYLLKHTDLLKVDQCLAYQLEKYHHNDYKAFARLLTLMLRKFGDVIIPEKTVLPIREWIVSKEKHQEVEQGSISVKKHGRINRRADDNITSLNREQTILLIQYLKEAGIFLKDEYLTDADAGKAFELLTGFSQNTLRQDLCKFYQFESKENQKKLHQIFSHLIHQLESKMK